MDLLELLEVNRDRLPKRTEGAVRYLHRRWVELGEPREPKVLADFLDGVLRFCPIVGFVYPKILLKRLKQLQRGEWFPRAEA
jgi:hypothetical protein